MTAFVKDLSKQLAKCLADLQLNNKPLAANALGDLLCAAPREDTPELLKGVIKPLMLACADGKDTMREATINAIDKACVNNDKVDQKCVVSVMGGFSGVLCVI
jgi:hypothetical protein